MTTDARALRDKVTQAGARAGGAAQAGAAQEQSRGDSLRRADLIAALGSRIARIENRPPAFDPAHETSAATGPVLSLGMTGIDAMLAGREAGTAPIPRCRPARSARRNGAGRGGGDRFCPGAGAKGDRLHRAVPGGNVLDRRP